MSNEQTELLEEAVKWLRILGKREARELAVEALSYDNEEKQESAKIVYELSNGDNTTKDIAQYIPYSYRWVSYRQNEWRKLGILEKERSQGPYTHITSLENLGMDPPEIPDIESSEEG